MRKERLKNHLKAAKNWTFLRFCGIIVIEDSYGILKNLYYLEDRKMFNEEIFNFDIDNIRNDLAIEGMSISDEDVNLFKQFANDEIDMPNLIQTIKNEIN